ncbi:MAG: hypothetical protein FWH17_06100 [Oscillospiraceae bacterium]|nr:hypothetical protein [Oscillospiraceae bacterium]
MDTGYLTMEILLSPISCAAAVAALVQLTKRHVMDVDPKWLALAFAFITQIAVLMHGGIIGVTAILLMLLNTLIVAGAAIGAFEGVKSLARAVKEDEDDAN